MNIEKAGDLLDKEKLFRINSSVLILFFFFLYFYPSTPLASNEALTQLRKAHTLDCRFNLGNIADWTGNNFRIEKTKDTMRLYFNNIDISKSRATITENASSEEVHAFLTPRGMTFIETTMAGNMNITTVFPYHGGRGHFPAVTSRHIMIVNPLPSQRYGACKILVGIDVTKNQLYCLGEIRKLYKRDYLRSGGRIKVWLYNLKQNIWLPLTSKQKNYLAKYNSLKRAVVCYQRAMQDNDLNLGLSPTEFETIIRFKDKVLRIKLKNEN